MSSDAVVLQGGVIIDGTGQERRRSDVRFESGKIVGVGVVDTTDAEIVDVDGLFVAPGFIDPHTHLDAQVLWDSDVTPSTWHGVTTVVMGNCGFGIAPTRPEHRELICRTLENVEGMPIEALESGITWSFESFSEYLDALDARSLRTNVAAMVGHTPLRIFVMGDDASSRPASAEEIAEMVALARSAIEAGAVGIASSRALAHTGAFGAPVPSRLAEIRELEALAEVLADAKCGVMQIVGGPGMATPQEFSHLAVIAGRPLTWTPLFTNGHTLDILDETAQLPGEVWPQMSCRPIVSQATLKSPAPFAMLPSFERVLRASPSDRAAIYRDSQWRDEARVEVDGRWGSKWSQIRVKESRAHPELIDGPSMADLGSRLNLHPFDVMANLSLEEDLDTRFEIIGSNDDASEVADLLSDDRSLLGLSDAGAHVREMCDSCYPTFLLGTWVRERNSLSWEQAIWRMTDHPASVFGLRNRGRIEQGYDADIVVFDPNTISAGSSFRVWDLPAGADRLVASSTGIQHVWVNGRISRRDGEDIVGGHHGKLLRWGGKEDRMRRSAALS